MIPVYQAPPHILTPAVEDAMRYAWSHLCQKEGWLDSRNIPTPHDGGVVYQDNEMQFVAYVADEGSVPFSLHGPVLRALADRFGYEKSANCKAMVLQCAENKLLSFNTDNTGQQYATMTDYGWETLARWEAQREEDIALGIIEPDALPTQDEIQIAALLWQCDETEAENRLIGGYVAPVEEKWDEGTLFYE